MSETTGGSVSVEAGGIDFQVASNTSSAEDMKANFAAEPKDGEPELSDEDKAKVAAAELGKRGGKASAEARAKAKDDLDDEPEAKPKETKVKPAEPEAEEEAPGNPRHDSRARIQQLAREKREAKERADKLEAELAIMRQARLETKEEPKVTPTDPNLPKLDNFETYEQWVEATIDYKSEQKLQKVLKDNEQRERAEAHAADVTRKMEAFHKRLADGAEVLRDEAGIAGIRVDGRDVDSRLLELTPTFTLHPDEQPGPLNDIAEYVFTSEQMPRLLLHLTEHPDEMAALTRMPNAREIARAIGRIEARLSNGNGEAPKAAPAPKPAEAPRRPAVSQAEPPVRPLASSAVLPAEDIDGIEDFDAYVAAANAREIRQRRGGR